MRSNTTRAEYGARLDAKIEKRKVLGALIFRQVLAIEKDLEALSQKNGFIGDSGEWQACMDGLAAIRAYLEELQ